MNGNPKAVQLMTEPSLWCPHYPIATPVTACVYQAFSICQAPCQALDSQRFLSLSYPPYEIGIETVPFLRYKLKQPLLSQRWKKSWFGKLQMEWQMGSEGLSELPRIKPLVCKTHMFLCGATL